MMFFFYMEKLDIGLHTFYTEFYHYIKSVRPLRAKFHRVCYLLVWNLQLIWNLLTTSKSNMDNGYRYCWNSESGSLHQNITRILNTPRLKIMNGCPDFYPMVDANSSRVADPDPSPSGSNPREKMDPDPTREKKLDPDPTFETHFRS